MSINTQNYRQENNNMSLFFDVLFFFLLFQFVVFTKVLMAIKAVTLLFLMLIWALQRKTWISIDKKTIVLSVYILYNIFSTFWGIVNGFSSVAIRHSTINVIWPTSYLFFIEYFVSKDRVKKLHKMLFLLALIICILDSLIILSYVFHMPTIMTFLNTIHLGGSAGTAGLVFFRSEHMYFYAFFAPYTIAEICLKKEDIIDSGLKYKFAWFVAIYCTIMAVFSGMGGIWVSVMVAIVLSVFRSKCLKRNTFFVAMMVFLFVLFCYGIYSYLREGIVYHVLQEINVHLGSNTNDKSWIIRNNQKNAMIHEWLLHPLFGKGIGGTIVFDKAGTIVEQSESELSYFVMLYQRGIVGVLLFFSVVVCSIRSLLERIDIRWLAEPFLVGLVSFLVAHAFNPYLSNMSTMWILFLPLILGNGSSKTKIRPEIGYGK